MGNVNLSFNKLYGKLLFIEKMNNWKVNQKFKNQRNRLEREHAREKK